MSLEQKQGILVFCVPWIVWWTSL